MEPTFLGELQRTLDTAPPYALVPALALALAEAIEAKDVAVYLADYGAVSLERVGPDTLRAHDDDRLPVDWTTAGECLRTQTPVVTRIGEAWQLDVPVSVRSERLGVLRVLLSDEPTDELIDVLAQVGGTLGYTIATARRYTDYFERIRRRRDLALAAEIQWELLPVLAYTGEGFSLAGALEPAYDIAGDSFDYAVDASGLTLFLCDAAGHGLRAAMTAVLAVGALRNARRRGLDVVEQAQTANEALSTHLGDEEFVTAMLIAFDTEAASAVVVNAGHSLLWRCRDDAIEPVPLVADPPFGIDVATRFVAQSIDLTAGDRLVLVSDGAITAAAEDGAPFGYEGLSAMLEQARGADPADTVRTIAQAVVSHRLVELADDVTVVCLDWLS